MEEDSKVTTFPVILENIDSEAESSSEQHKPEEQRPGVLELRSMLNKYFKVEMTDGRILIGIFLCTDRDSNIILGSCSEFLPSENKSKTGNEEPRILGLVMIPGKHIVSLQLDSNQHDRRGALPKYVCSNEEVM